MLNCSTIIYTAPLNKLEECIKSGAPEAHTWVGALLLNYNIHNNNKQVGIVYIKPGDPEAHTWVDALLLNYNIHNYNKQVGIVFKPGDPQSSHLSRCSTT